MRKKYFTEEERRAAKKASTQRWQKAHPEKTRLYNKRMMDRIKQDPQALAAFYSRLSAQKVIRKIDKTNESIDEQVEFLGNERKIQDLLRLKELNEERKNKLMKIFHLSD